jgi:hypothetical protein
MAIVPLGDEMMKTRVFRGGDRVVLTRDIVTQYGLIPAGTEGRCGAGNIENSVYIDHPNDSRSIVMIQVPLADRKHAD